MWRGDLANKNIESLFLSLCFFGAGSSGAESIQLTSAGGSIHRISRADWGDLSLWKEQCPNQPLLSDACSLLHVKPVQTILKLFLALSPSPSMLWHILRMWKTCIWNKGANYWHQPWHQHIPSHLHSISTSCPLTPIIFFPLIVPCHSGNSFPRSKDSLSKIYWKSWGGLINQKIALDVQQTMAWMTVKWDMLTLQAWDGWIMLIISTSGEDRDSRTSFDCGTRALQCWS